MKNINRFCIFLVIGIIIVTFLFQMKNTQLRSQIKPNPVSGNIDERKIIQETPKLNNPQIPPSPQNEVSSKDGKKIIPETQKPNNSQISPTPQNKVSLKGENMEKLKNLPNDTIITISNIYEDNIKTSGEPKNHRKDNTRANIDNPPSNTDQDHQEKSTQMIALSDNSFMIHPGWVKEEYRSEKFKQYVLDDQSVCFTIEEPLKSMKWSQYFEKEIDPQVYSQIVFEYTAERLKAVENEYTLWLFDLRGGYGGFTAISSTQIISDGTRHIIQVDLNQFDIKEFIHQIAIQAYSEEEGNASLTIHKIEFLPKENDKK